jgi:hypothetical protein
VVALLDLRVDGRGVGVTAWPSDARKMLELIHGRISQQGHVQFSIAPPVEEVPENEHGVRDPWDKRQNLFFTMTPEAPDEQFFEEMPEPLPVNWQDYEWFFTPALLSQTQERRKSIVLEVATLYADFDKGVDLTSLAPQPSIINETSPGRYHCFWLLEEAHPLQTVEVYNYRIKAAYPADNTWDSSRLLRLPIGRMSPEKDAHGHLISSRGPVPGIIRAENVRYRLEDFDHLPKVDPHVGTDEQLGEAPAILTRGEAQALISMLETKGQITKRLKSYLEKEQTPRYLALNFVYNECHRKGISAAQCFQIVYGSPNDKWVEHGHNHAKELWRDVCQRYRAADEQEESLTILSQLELVRQEKDLTTAAKREKFGAAVIRDLEQSGVFIQTKEPRLYYYQDGSTHELVQIDQKGEQFRRYIMNRYRIDAGNPEFTIVYYHMEAKAQEFTPVPVYRNVHYNRETNRLYINRFDGRMYRLDGESIVQLPNGTDDVLFLKDEDAMPWTYLPTEDTTYPLWSRYILSLNIASQTDQKVLRHIVWTWIVQMFFRELMPTKPILFLGGVPGCGKTSFFKAVNAILRLGRFAIDDVPGDKKEFDTTVANRDYVFFDDVNDYQAWMASALSRLASSYDFTRRQLYTTNDVLYFRASCTIGLTSNTPKFTTSNVVDRMIPLDLLPRDEDQFFSEDALEQEIGEQRPQLWGELLSYLNAMLRMWKANGVPYFRGSLRLADFGTMLNSTCAITGVDTEACITFIRGEQTREAIDGEPLMFCLYEWLAFNQGGNYGRTVSASSLHQELQAMEGGAAYRQAVGGPSAIGRKLQAMQKHLQSKGILFEKEAGKDERVHYKFSKVGD